MSGLIRGVAELPPCARSTELAVRWNEVREGMTQIENLLEEAESKMDSFLCDLASAGVHELELLSDRLECGAGLAAGLSKGVGLLSKLESSRDHEATCRKVSDLHAKVTQLRDHLFQYRDSEFGSTGFTNAWPAAELI